MGNDPSKNSTSSIKATTINIRSKTKETGKPEYKEVITRVLLSKVVNHFHLWFMGGHISSPFSFF